MATLWLSHLQVVPVRRYRLLYLRETHAIHINDFDPAIHDFWYSAVYENDAMISYLDEVPVSVEEWRRWKKVYKNSECVTIGTRIRCILSQSVQSIWHY